ncbi:MAG: Glycosyl transferase, group 1 [Candidatus Moranbacteria bacterium GW2011_GWF2_36_839]|nr:MAG: Glycosyl transferase, group 1 [Candidatus Moranbacteria bacterium GW2011_GWF1_36_78]KKQ17270.1 MAG: Glycosyl transferase, group 1 [Candidatus Moranbacteria bacterium GW2011_GWF2_36_839]HAT73887.1 glycosyltransferase family 4 protein [Candidatus Moranbacteria bacterium]HBY10970.1 glycosyltransferase family 4 protein [Candidatus Moranbacteria bacterium]
MEEKNINNLRVALVHDFLNQYGGAEKVLEVLCEMFPTAPIYTLIYDNERMGEKFLNREIHTSFLQKLPKFFRRRFKYFLLFLPTAPESFDLRNFDLVISSSGAWSKGIITRLDTMHIAYIHSPMRFVWDYNEKYLRDERKEKWGFIIRPILSYFRIWDKLAADRPDYLIANSEYTRSRIKKYYRRESEIIYPPVNHETYNMKHETAMKNEKYFLIVSRLSAYKKIDKAIEAFNKLELPLVIVGTGKEEKRLKKIAKSNIKFLGFQKDEKLPDIYENARAFIFPGVDDFGIAPVEAMMHGIAVIAIKDGGVVEIIEEGKNGEFFESGAPEVIADGVRRFCENEKNYNREYIIRSVEKFGKERFKKEMEEYIKKIISNS